MRNRRIGGRGCLPAKSVAPSLPPGPTSTPSALLPITFLSLQIRRDESAGSLPKLWWPAAASGGLLPTTGFSTASASSACIPAVDVPHFPPSLQGWRERSGHWHGEDTGAVEERLLSSFPVANKIVEAHLQLSC
jgi:hypothetical protein